MSEKDGQLPRLGDLTPREKEGNQYSGFDPLMVSGDGMMMYTLKKCFRRLSKNDQEISWINLEEDVEEVLRHVMGDEEFETWIKSL